MGGIGKPATGSWVDTRIQCPEGYRPRTGTTGQIIGMIPGAAGACVWVQTVPAGAANMQMLLTRDLAVSNDYRGVGCWATSDAWPS